MAIFDFNSYVQDTKLLSDKIEELMKLIEDDYENRKIVYQVQFSDGIHDIKLANLITKLIFAHLYVGYDLSYDLTIETENINNSIILPYLNNYIEFALEEGFKLKELTTRLHEVLFGINMINIRFSVIQANSISVYGIIELMKKNKKFRELINRKYSVKNKTSFDIEKMMADDMTEVTNLLKKEDNILKPFLMAKDGINMGQLGQLLFNIGPKPDMKGNVFPLIVNTNYLRGLRTPSDYFIDASGGRKSSIINAEQVKRAGYLNRKLTLMTENIRLSDVDSCDSNGLKVIIQDQNHLNRLKGRYYNLPDGDILYMIDRENTSLIGTEIMLHSPITCSLDDDCICKKCYGHLSRINNDINIGIFSVQELSEILTQLLLSAKHLLKTSSEKIVFNDEFLNFFSINELEISSNYDMKIIVDKNDLLTYEDDYTGVSYVNIKNFSIECDNKVYKIDNDKNLLLVESLIDKMEDNNDKIEITVDTDDNIFIIDVENNELSKNLLSIISLIDTDSIIKDITIEDLYKKMTEILNASKIGIHSIHYEIILRYLVRDINDILERPKYIKPDNYKIVRMTTAIMNSPYLSTSLAFERISQQLYDINTYRKHKKGILDEFLI